MKKIIYIFLLLNTIACKKYLELKPNNALSTPQSVSDLQAVLDNPDNTNFRSVSSLAQGSCDDFFSFSANLSIFLGYIKEVYSWRYLNYTYNNDWSQGYIPVYHANLCLDYIDQMPRTSDNAVAWDNVKGSALFIRAYSFLNLVWTFSKAYDETASTTDLGICLRMTSDFNVPSTRASVKESYEQIISDAQASLNYLPDLPLHTSRPSKVATYGLLARTYLSMRVYDSALKYSNLSLSLKNDLIDYSTEIAPSATAPFLRYNKETIYHSGMSSKYSFFSRPNGLVDSALRLSYESNDVRKTAFLVLVPANGHYGFKGNYTGSASSFFTGLATDEMYLISAECYARKGDKTNALTQLNTLLAKRYDATFSPVALGNADLVLTRILLERRKELLYRGLRWIDIKRLNKEGANITQNRILDGQTFTLAPNSNYYALPLPSDIINLTGMPQNPQ